MNSSIKTLSGLLFAGAESIRDNCVLSLNKNERFGKVFKERMKVLKKMFF